MILIIYSACCFLWREEQAGTKHIEHQQFMAEARKSSFNINHHCKYQNYACIKSLGLNTLGTARESWFF